MATAIKLKKSSVAGKVPLAGDLAYGELAINYQDGKLFYKDASNNVRAFLDSGQVLELLGDPETIFSIVNNGSSAYTFSGDGFSSSVDNPTLYLTRGKTYKFAVNASGHPFQIRLSSGGSAYSNGVTNNGAQTGDIYFTPDMNAPNSLVYQCTVHSGMVGDIVIIDNDSFLDSAEASTLITNTVDKAFVDALNVDADTLDGQDGTYYLNYNNFTNTPTVVDSADVSLIILSQVDSAYVQQRQSIQSLGQTFTTFSVSGQSNIVADSTSDVFTFAAGSGITLTTNASTDTLTITSTGLDSAGVIALVDSDYVNARVAAGAGATSAFSKIAVSGQSTVEADSTGDTLTLVAGSNITLTTNAATDTVTITSTASGGGGSSIANDVTVNSFSGDSSTTSFTLSAAPLTDQNVFVTINGVSQHIDAYSLSGTTITFDSAPAVGDAIETRVITAATVSLRDHTDYIYQLSPAGYTCQGSDINGNTLSYDIGKIEVFLNGSRLTPTLDYTAVNGTSVTLLTDYPVDSDDTVVISSFGKAYLIDRGVVPAEADGTDSAAQFVADTYNATLYRTSKYIIQLEHDSDNKYHAAEVLLTHNGTSVFLTEYGQVTSDSSLGTFDADILGGNVRLLVTPSYTNTSIKTQRITVGA